MSKDDLIGVTLGECEILRKLGEGGMGTVYLADHKTLDMQVAVKVLDTDLNKDSEFIERFKREAQQTARLDHPNIMRIFGVSEAKGMHFMISAFIDGPTLDQMLKNQVLSEEKAIAYILQVLNGLEYAHRDNIIHRDIKPSNIMVNRNDEVKITDFGLVRSLDTDISITKTGVPLGTPAFMSPEQWENKGIDQRADVFSVAVTLYKLLSNKYPFEGESSISIYRAIATGDIIPIRRWQPDIDPELERILQKGMRPNKDTRYQTAYNFAAALKKYLLKTSDTPTKYLAMYPYDVLDDKHRDSSDFKNLQSNSSETKTFSGKKYENLAQRDQTPVTPQFSPIFDPVAQENKQQQYEYQGPIPTPTGRSGTAAVTPQMNTPMLDEIDVKNLQALNKFIKFRRIGLIFFLLIFFLLIGNLIGSHKSNQLKQEEFEEVSAFVKAQLGTAKDCEEYIRKYPEGRYKDNAEQLRKLKIQLEKNALKEEESKNALKETRDGWILDGTMTLKAGIHNFPGKFVISDKSLLKIEAGAVIEFDKKSSIVCYGVIKADGKPGNPIKFAAKNEKEGWQGISFIGDKCSDSYLEYCILSNGHGVPLHNQNGILTFVDFETDEQTHYGGALVIFNNANIKLTNCTFMNNQSNAGGGAVLCSGAKPRFMYCSFIKNKVDYNANNSFGGAILVQKESLIEISHCQFRDNSATFGGAIYVEYSNPYIYDSHFQNNGITDEPSVESYGGAIYISKSNGFTLFDSSFKENGATKSGGALYYHDSESYILNARFNGNTVTSKDGYGGAMSYEDSSRLALIGCTFERNSCEGKGGAMYIGRKTETAIHVAFILGNVADEGAGMYIEDETKLSFMGVKIIRNNATTKGGGIYKKKEAMPYMDNTVIEENTPDQVIEEE